MPKHSLAIGLATLAAAALTLPAQVRAEHENRYFGFGFQPYAYSPYPPPVYTPPPGVRETAPGVYEYQVGPGRWVRFRPAYGYQPLPPRHRRNTQPQPQEALRSQEPRPWTGQKTPTMPRSRCKAPRDSG